MEKCNICGKEKSANNLTWSDEMVCDRCVDWIDTFQHDINNTVYDLLATECPPMADKDISFFAEAGYDGRLTGEVI